METLNITKDAAIKAHENANEKGKALLENLLGKKVFVKDIRQRIKSFDDVLTELRILPAKFFAACEGLTSDEIAYMQAKYLAKALNEGWEPDWTNNNQPKYRLWFNFNDPSAVGRFSFNAYGLDGSLSLVGSRLCFKSAELAKYAGETFTEIYRAFMTI